MNKLETLLKGKKVSVIFNEYASPILEFYLEEAGYDNLDQISIEEMNQILQLPWLIWNAVVAKEFNNKIDFLGSIKLLTRQTPSEIQRLIDYMKERKETKFKKYNFYLGDYALKRDTLNNQVTLTLEARWSTKL